ncbi:hypothetical protein [Lactobacillus delbrueckii]|uniref:hypothetical protein n=1 Tax=Lactobacillus delbrueckii TaxID=1584 RepID=UPI001F35344A|nr:hypothetical protein [Lactobacillus delbrueckii]GHN53678.1 hypothetical membrane protein [Lactobacillus delbrueckii]
MKKFLRVPAVLLSAAAILDSLYWLFVGHSYLRVAFLKLTGGNGISSWLQIAVIAGILLFLSQYDRFFDPFLRDERDRKYK